MSDTLLTLERQIFDSSPMKIINTKIFYSMLFDLFLCRVHWIYIMKKLRVQFGLIKNLLIVILVLNKCIYIHVCFYFITFERASKYFEKRIS